ncbi:hypothetical protein AWM70_21500 [Paenibacillus yonginensis]|uniref:DUF4870 domain-containing protein n=1 Tax=Paenibacillus yonginensis TaxID=1462996 RepID=A0A1B1N5W0_9BACL|nr:hypothetical protein [Paenibacillus yonginensis]ANS76838.1 hypothetical protein AWM70_21500 [Paenibacillus yonginensis]
MTPFRSSTGLPESLAAFLCHLFPFVGGIIFLVIEKRSRFVLFHALQSVLLFGGLIVSHTVAGFIPILGIALAALLSIAGVLFWVALIIASLQSKWLKLPWIGDFAEKQIRNW